MVLPAGTRLGPYEILSPLGAGGMGEVYRAEDARLGREVAIKVLPEEFLNGKEKKQRFEREARLLATLNHPGIAAIYSFEEIPGSPLYLRQRENMLVRVFRLDLQSGRRQLWREVKPQDPAGFLRGTYAINISTDGESIVCTYLRALNDLYLVEGLK
ncbi:MAG: protein kinase [Acidobacteriota bacterium]|nr:protein kinase [Acidobacteriota bacterium]